MVVEKERNKGAEKSLPKMFEIFLKFGKAHEDLRNSTNPKQDKYEENYAEANHYQIAENPR